jgi:DNA modification methylase
MKTPNVPTRHDHLTFKGNLKQTRYGWLRLTPAYSVHLVADLLDACAHDNAVVLDPFCGTGTTALVCAERGIECDTTDINPFLVWMCQTKARAYSAAELDAFQTTVQDVAAAMREQSDQSEWVPPLHQIEKWWDKHRLAALARAMACIKRLSHTTPQATIDLLKITFCKTMIEQANVSFGHQSMSFKVKDDVPILAAIETIGDTVAAAWERAAALIAAAARSPIARQPRPLLCDARNLTAQLQAERYSCIITSPPYPNRMSYIRELRPYMYWLGYLSDGGAAGELDWQAIGGTWGIATSNVAKWSPDVELDVPYDGFNSIVERIAERSKVLSRYVQKYFHDMVLHCNELYQVVKPGGTITYIVGNSKFYDVMLPVEDIFASMFEAAGFANVQITTVRKRTSKKELFEFAVSARK